MSFKSDYPDLSEAACRQIDFLFPAGSQSRLPDGSLPLDRIATLGYSGLCDAIGISPLVTRRLTGEFDILSSEPTEAEKLAGEIATWLVTKGQSVPGWPLPPTRYNSIHPFVSLPDRVKSKTVHDVLVSGKRELTTYERRWLLDVLGAIADSNSYPSSRQR